MFLSIHRPGSGKRLHKASSPGDIDSFVNSYSEGLLVVLIILDVPLEAFVVRGGDGREMVFLKSGSLRHRVERSVGDDESPDRLGVSCRPYGDFVPVRTINVRFRSSDDMLTDRGLVRVHGGEFAGATLFLHPTSIRESDTLPSEIVAAAVDAIRHQVLRPFLN